MKNSTVEWLIMVDNSVVCAFVDDADSSDWNNFDDEIISIDLDQYNICLIYLNWNVLDVAENFAETLVVAWTDLTRIDLACSFVAVTLNVV